ncbi:MAG: hypothetical protein GOU97_04300 [Nanoarchaeota archaeon]|nr:hypothetical protein [Nanoarchaeota archaeon]
MNDKKTGIIIIGIAVVVLFIVVSYDNALTRIVETSCSHGTSCLMYDVINVQKQISIALVILLIGAGVFIALSSDIKRFFVKTVKVRLSQDEKKIHDFIKKEKGSAYQSDIVKATGLSKVKVTRLLDKMEGKKIVERRRRGMTNIVFLK